MTGVLRNATDKATATKSGRSVIMRERGVINLEGRERVKRERGKGKRESKRNDVGKRRRIEGYFA